MDAASLQGAGPAFDRGWASKHHLDTASCNSAGDSSGMVQSLPQLWGRLPKHSERVRGVVAACFLEKEF